MDDNNDTIKLRVAWLCYFSNREVQSILHPNYCENEFAPWITNLAKLFEDDINIELHIISPQNQIKGYKQFKIKNINYHFFNPHVIIFGFSLAKFHMNYRTNFIFLKFIIRKIINDIKPDIIHLHGAEVDYSSSIFQFWRKYPVLITIQGFVSHTPTRNDFFTRYRSEVEQKILKKFKHFGYRTQTMGKDILNYNPNAVLHWHHYPVPIIKVVQVEKKYDLVFFARVTKDKGIEDLLKCLAEIKRFFPKISLCIIGSTNETYRKYLFDFSKKLKLSNNICWMGYIQNHSDMLKVASSARISVLPTQNDIISGTIIESMLLKLPVVAYNVGSIHEINDTGHFINLVKKGDIGAMANIIISLLHRKNELELMGKKGYNRALTMFNNDFIHSDLTNAYKIVVKDFYSQKQYI